jgi:GAF domain-containing protein
MEAETNAGSDAPPPIARIEAQIAAGAPLRETLDDLVRLVESLTPSDMLASILILDESEQRLRHMTQDVEQDQGFGRAACWSTPIHGSDGRVLGTFANYYRVVRDPSPRDLRLTDMITHVAATAIEQDRRARATM